MNRRRRDDVEGAYPAVYLPGNRIQQASRHRPPAGRPPRAVQRALHGRPDMLQTAIARPDATIDP